MGPCATPRSTGPAMVHWWDELTFLHWDFDPHAVQRLLPAGLTVETMEGHAWVGLVPFFLHVGLPRVPSVPWLSRFAETNVRTYVRSEDGARGIWFFSLDAALPRCGGHGAGDLPPAVLLVGDVDRPVSDDDLVSVSSALARASGARSDALIEIGDPFRPDELTELDHFLTARWALFSAPRSGLRHALAVHEPWPLHRAKVVELHDELVAAAGLPQPTEEPIVHHSPTVAVRIGWPSRIDRV